MEINSAQPVKLIDLPGTHVCECTRVSIGRLVTADHSRIARWVDGRTDRLT
jgi:hypothetical protein